MNSLLTSLIQYTILFSIPLHINGPDTSMDAMHDSEDFFCEHVRTDGAFGITSVLPHHTPQAR
jgi:hypothetical protein